MAYEKNIFSMKKYVLHERKICYRRKKNNCYVKKYSEWKESNKIFLISPSCYIDAIFGAKTENKRDINWGADSIWKEERNRKKEKETEREIERNRKRNCNFREWKSRLELSVLEQNFQY